MDTTTTIICSADPFLPPGFRFYPTEEELLGFYLRHRLAGTRPDVERFVPVVDIYSYHPRDLQQMAGAANVRDREQWFFFCPRAERELHGGRPARTTPSGYWKATGSPSWVVSASSSRVIGEKRTMVFYQGRAPTGAKTKWKMNEYKAVAEPAAVPDVALVPLRDVQLRNEFTVCRVYISTGTLRSTFDRRPINHAAAGHGHAAVHHHRSQQQQQQQQLLVLPPPATTTTGNYVVVDDNNDGRQKAENSHDDSSSSGSRGTMVIGDAAIDWNSLTMIPPLLADDDDGLTFGADGLARTVWPQI